MRKLVIISVLIMLISVFISFSFGKKKSNDHPIDKWLEKCLAKNQTTSGMLTCINQASEKWDQELNLVYGQLIKKLSPEGITALKQSQRIWLQHRDAEIKLIGNIYYKTLQGTMYQVFAANNVMDLVKKRSLRLKSYLDDIGLGSE